MNKTFIGSNGVALTKERLQFAYQTGFLRHHIAPLRLAVHEH